MNFKRVIFLLFSGDNYALNLVHRIVYRNDTHFYKISCSEFSPVELPNLAWNGRRKKTNWVAGANFYKFSDVDHGSFVYQNIHIINNLPH